MKIEAIDPNFAQNTSTEGKLVFHSCRREPFRLYGLESIEPGQPFARVSPQNAQAYGFSDNLRELMHHTSGGRIRFQTDSRELALRVQLDGRVSLPHLSPVAAMGVDLYTRSPEDRQSPVFLTSIPPKLREDDSYEGIYRFRDPHREMREFTIHLPLYCKVKEVEIGVEQGAKLNPPQEYQNQRPVGFYGSSITQGACSSRPGNSYPAILSRMLDWDIRNLGFSGNAFGEPEVARYIGELDLGALVLDYDYNAPSEEHLRATHYRFYQIVREKQPNLPIVMLSAPVAPPTVAKVRDKRMDMARAIIMESYVRGKMAGDQNLYFVDGESLLGDLEAQDALLDEVHPNDLGFRQMAHRVYPILHHIQKHSIQ